MTIAQIIGMFSFRGANVTGERGGSIRFQLRCLRYTDYETSN
jgi:hypothetical protein